MYRAQSHASRFNKTESLGFADGQWTGALFGSTDGKKGKVIRRRESDRRSGYTKAPRARLAA